MSDIRLASGVQLCRTLYAADRKYVSQRGALIGEENLSAVRLLWNVHRSNHRPAASARLVVDFTDGFLLWTLVAASLMFDENFFHTALRTR